LSHLKERKEKNCLNCNAVVDGKYCSICGQENIEPAESGWHLITHFFNDITHFDGKFFSSLNYLIFKPGFLSTEYKLGRRASYLNPVRMYVFTSFLFFLVFFSVYHMEELHVDTNFDAKQWQEIRAMDSVQLNKYLAKLEDSSIHTKDQLIEKLDTTKKKGFTISSYRDKKQYDSLLTSGAQKDNWLKRKMNYRQLELKEKYNGDSNKMIQALLGSFSHRFPQMLFLSLPLFALISKLIYIRRKDFYYVSHGIFAIHLYVFTFMILLANIGVNSLIGLTSWDWLNWVNGFLYICLFIYQYKAMRNFYGQSRGKTVLKFIILNIALLFLMVFIFVGFLVFSYLKV
jgi:hypothetical protein